MVTALACPRCGAEVEDEGLCVRCWDTDAEARPEVRERLRAYRQRPEVRERKRAYQRAYAYMRRQQEQGGIMTGTSIAERARTPAGRPPPFGPRAHPPTLVPARDGGRLARLPLRFWAKVRLGNGCWEWVGARTSDGYGKFWANGARRMVRAHRLAYEVLRGPIPPDLESDHLCRNRACVNPQHIELVAHRENSLRGDWPNARKMQCPQGHPYDSGNTLLWNGRRQCRTCHREYLRAYRQRQRSGSAGVTKGGMPFHEMEPQVACQSRNRWGRGVPQRPVLPRGHRGQRT